MGWRVITFHLRGTQCKRFSMRLSALALTLGVAVRTAAHDFWIEPGSFRLKAGARVPLRLHVGKDFKGDTALFNSEEFVRYIVGVRAAKNRSTAIWATTPRARSRSRNWASTA